MLTSIEILGKDGSTRPALANSDEKKAFPVIPVAAGAGGGGLLLALATWCYFRTRGKETFNSRGSGAVSRKGSRDAHVEVMV